MCSEINKTTCIYELNNMLKRKWLPIQHPLSVRKQAYRVAHATWRVEHGVNTNHQTFVKVHPDACKPHDKMKSNIVMQGRDANVRFVVPHDRWWAIANGIQTLHIRADVRYDGRCHSVL